MRLLHPSTRALAPEDLFDLYDVPGPHLRAGFVTSADGAIAVDGTSGGLQSPADKAVYAALRACADAVVVGAGTAREEDYGPVRFGPAAAAWRAAHGRSPQAPLVVVSRSGQVADEARWLEGDWLLAVPEGTQVDRDVDVVPSDPAGLVVALQERGFTRILCEGGPSLLTSLLVGDVIDELCLTTTPLLVGEGPHLLGEVDPRQLVLLSLVHDDPGVLLARWSVVRSTA